MTDTTAAFLLIILVAAVSGFIFFIDRVGFRLCRWQARRLGCRH